MRRTRGTTTHLRRVAAGCAAACLGGLSLLSVAAPAHAGPTIPSLPRIDAADYTPRVVDDSVVPEAGVRELRQVGATMYAGGDFHTVLSASRATRYTRTNLFSFDPPTGAVSSWAPAVSGPVYAMEPSADGRYLYIGGDFRTFDGQQVNRLVKYDLTSHRVDPTFRFPLTVSRVSDLQLVGSRLLVSGTFTGGLVAVDPVTGARTSYLDGVQVAGGGTQWSTRVYRFAFNPAATRMAIIGSFTSVGTRARQEVALVDLGATASVSAWHSPRWDQTCGGGTSWYTRDVDWAPDGSGFVVVGSGGGAPGTTKLCDTASWWRPTAADNQSPVWVNYSGGDTFHSVTVTDRAVVVGGHFRWLDNPSGDDSAGPGAVSRHGIGAIDPATGKALSWNPYKSTEGGLGAYDLYFTGRGLWVAHFEQYLGTGPTGHELHEGLGLLPY